MYEGCGLPEPNFSKNCVSLINDYSAVVLEYFQQRVEAWIETIGKQLFHIDHVRGKYEFALSCRQIHIHLLAICNKNNTHIKICHEILKDGRKNDLANYLGKWLGNTVGLTAMVDDCVNEIDINKCDHPSSYNFSDVPQDEVTLDATKCQVKFQSHKCSNYCMRKQKYIPKSETTEEKREWFVDVELVLSVLLVVVTLLDFN